MMGGEGREITDVTLRVEYTIRVTEFRCGRGVAKINVAYNLVLLAGIPAVCITCACYAPFEAAPEDADFPRLSAVGHVAPADLFKTPSRIVY